jgi:uncharacterized membrane protein YhiD involved in acid resistance
MELPQRKDGFSIRGMHTAATLWCTAAIGTVGVLSANLLLRSVAHRVNRARPPVEPLEEVVLCVLECVGTTVW